jgi:hypothetical protein
MGEIGHRARCVLDFSGKYHKLSWERSSLVSGGSGTGQLYRRVVCSLHGIDDSDDGRAYRTSGSSNTTTTVKGGAKFDHRIVTM